MWNQWKPTTDSRNNVGNCLPNEFAEKIQALRNGQAATQQLAEERGPAWGSRPQQEAECADQKEETPEHVKQEQAVIEEVTASGRPEVPGPEMQEE